MCVPLRRTLNNVDARRGGDRVAAAALAARRVARRVAVGARVDEERALVLALEEPLFERLRGEKVITEPAKYWTTEKRLWYQGRLSNMENFIHKAAHL